MINEYCNFTAMNVLSFVGIDSFYVELIVIVYRLHIPFGQSDLSIIITFEERLVRFSDAGCPDRLCVNRADSYPGGIGPYACRPKQVILIRDSARPVDGISY